VRTGAFQTTYQMQGGDHKLVFAVVLHVLSNEVLHTATVKETGCFAPLVFAVELHVLSNEVLHTAAALYHTLGVVRIYFN